LQIPLRRYRALLVSYLRRQRGRFGLLCALLLGSIGLQVGIPQITRRFIDAANQGAPDAALLAAAGAFIGLALLQQCQAIGSVWIGELVAGTATNELRADVAEHCLRLDMGFHNNRTPGELIERIDGDITALAEFFSQLVIRVLGNLLLLAGVLIALGLEDWRVGLAYSAFALISLAAMNRMREIAIPHEKARRQARAELFGFLEERLAGTEDIRASGAVAYVIDRLYRLQYRLLERWREVQLRYWFVGTVARGITAASFALAFGAGYLLFSSGQITVGTAYLFVHYSVLLARPFREISQQVESLQSVGASLERIEELVDLKSDIVDGTGAVIPSGAVALRFDDVSFAYGQNTEPVLRELSFELAPGTVTGVLGRTGSGKTTMTRIIARLYDPTTGSVSLNGIDLRRAHLAALRQRVAIVTQDVQIFQATVRDNLTFFSRDVSDARLLEVLDELELSEWLASLPAGLETRLASGGRSLSAGEGQLLAFARVFLRDPALVILDEASSRLDPATERRIERAMEKLLHGRTGLVVAHRLGTLRRTHQIMILEQGRIAEHGDREALAADPSSRFAGLLRTGLEAALL
jgi:ATP-binding cassette subfamily B protein